MKNMAEDSLSPQAKSTLKIIFLTLFLDLIGFSIIFPLFPSLLEYYLEVDGQNFLLRSILELSQSILQVSGAHDSGHNIVLFGGILGSLYSLLQFVAAPFWGHLSDRIGRKPVLMISLTGLLISYLLWFVSGSFSLLILARVLGGVMAGNISTASAAVADVTSRKNRSRGMAIIGIAFAIGFVIGPALGGLLSLWDLTQVAAFKDIPGLNPFSAPAAFAALLCLINLGLVAKNFRETLKKDDSKASQSQSQRTLSFTKLFAKTAYPGVNRTNQIYFLFLTAFSGMEFTLTFLAAQRLGFSAQDNGMMFVFIGVVMALVQGGFVRRRAAQIGEERLAFWGILLSLPGLLILARAQTTWLFYGGLFFLSLGASMIVPCLTALVSLFSPLSELGRCLVFFRSLGSLARVIGPFLAGIIYWRLGASWPYYLGSFFLLIPLGLAKNFPARERENQSQ